MTARNIFEPKDRFQRTTLAEDKQIIADCLEVLSAEYSLAKIPKHREGSIQRDLSRFDTLKEYEQVFIHDGIELKKDKDKSLIVTLSINSIVEVKHQHRIVRENITEFEFVGLATLKKDYGRVYIRTETLTDKLIELINPKEIDFDIDAAFSRNYFVLTNNELKLRKQVTANFLSAINKHKGLEIEIDGNTLMVRLRQRVSLKAAKTISEFLADINNGEN